jgi:hypothetical protein
MKHYWPYLPMIMIIALGIFINSLWSNSSVLSTSTNFSASALLAATNANRLANNQSELKNKSGTISCSTSQS